MEIFLTFSQIFVLAFAFSYSIRRLKKYTTITWEVRRGMKCYGCGTDVDCSTDDSILRFDEKNDTKTMVLCVACKREESLDSFIKTGFPDSTRTNKLRRFLFSKKSDRIIWYFLLSILMCIAIEIFARFAFGVRISWLLTPILNMAYWCIFCYRTKITYTEEKK